MSSRSMNLDVLVRLRDQLSGPLKRLRDTLSRIADMSRKFAVLGGAIAAISFMGPIREAAAFQQKLLDIAGTSKLVGKQAFQFTDEMRVSFETLALKTGQLSDTIASGYGNMIAAGLDKSIVDASIGDIARATKAANAEFGDMSNLAISMLQNIRLPADQLKDSLAALLQAGRLGAFELKDMAKYFPALTGQVAKFGVTGREAVNFLGTGLQIARMGTSDPAEAANNFKNFLDKVQSPQTLKNFRDAGVDLQAVMQNAAVKGINPLEAVLQKVSVLTRASGVDIGKMMKTATDKGLKGADALAQVREQLEKIHSAGKLGTLFQDQQVMGFLIPALANIQKFKDIKADVAAATGALSDASFETNMEALNSQLMTFQEIGVQAGREVGFAFGSWLPMINEQLEAAIKWYREWNKQTGGLGTHLLTLAGGGVLAATALGLLGVAVPVISAGFGVLGALLSPLGLSIAAIAGGAYLIYKHWDRFGPPLTRLWNSARGMFDRFVQSMSPVKFRAIAAGIAAMAGIFFPKTFALFILQDLFKWFDGRASVIGDISAKLNDLTGIDAGKIGNVFAALAAGGAGLIIFGGPLKALGGVLGSIARGLGLLGASEAAAGVAALETLGGLSVAGGLAALAVSAAAAAGSIKLLWDAIKNDKNGLNGALSDKILKPAANWALDNIGNLLGFGPQSPDSHFATTPPAEAQNKRTPMSAADRRRDQKTFHVIDLEAYRLGLAKQAAEDARKAGTLDNGFWWQKQRRGTTDTLPGKQTDDLVKAVKVIDIEAFKLELAKKATEDAKKAGALDNGFWWQKPKHGATDTLPGKAKDDMIPTLPAQKVDVGGSIVITVNGPGQVTSTTSTNKSVPITSSNTGKRLGRV